MRSYIYKKAAVLMMAVAAIFAISTGAQAQEAPQTVKVGLPVIKTGSVGEGISAQDLSAAVQNTLGEYLKGSKVEIVPLEARLASAITAEAAEKQCAYVLNIQVSHKKGGGGGFGKMFSSIAPVLSNVVPMGGMGGMGGAIASSVVSTAVTTAASTSANVKAKDEITLDIKLVNGANAVLSKQIKAKAKSEGEDIISPMIEQAAQAIVDSIGK